MEPKQPISQQRDRAPNALAIRSLILFMVLEYVRPPFIVELKLQMVLLIVIPVLWLMADDRPWSDIMTAQAIFFLLCCIEVPISSNNFWAYYTARMMYGYLAIALGFSWILSDRAAFRRVTWAWVLIMGYVAIYGIVHGGVGPGGGTLADENDLALGCATAFPLAFFGFERFSGWRRFLSATIAGLIVVAVVVSFSRGGLLGLVTAGLYCLAVSRHRFRNVLILMLAATLVVALAPTEGRKGRSWIDEIKSIGTESDEGTAKARRFMWESAFNMWKANPILGIGGGNFPFQVGEYQPRNSSEFEERIYNERDWSGSATHSLYFQVLAEHGTVGILLFGYLIWAHFRTLRRLRRDVRSKGDIPPDLLRDAEMYAAGLAGGVAAFCVAGTFLSVAYYPYLWHFSAMAVALDVAVRRELGAVDAGAIPKSPTPSRLATDGDPRPRPRK